MANVERGIKTFGTRQFATERAAAPGNKAPILSAELDQDFNTIYEAWNAGIEVGDLKPGFIITHAMLGVDAVESNNIKDGTITLNDLGSNSVDSSKIVNGSIAAIDLGSDSVTTVKILDGNVTTAKLAPGATVYTSGKHRRSNESVNITNATSSNFLSVANIRARSTGMVLIRVYAYGILAINDTTDETYGIRINRDAVNFAVFFQKGQGVNIPWTIYFDDILTTDTNPHTYSVDVYGSGNGFCILQGGSLVLMAPA